MQKFKRFGFNLISLWSPWSRRAPGATFKRKSFDCSWKTSRFSQLSDTDHPHDVDACRRVACGRVGDEGEVCRADVLLRRLQQVFFHPSFFEALYVLMREMQPLFAFQLNATPQWNNCHSGSQLQYQQYCNTSKIYLNTTPSSPMHCFNIFTYWTVPTSFIIPSSFLQARLWCLESSPKEALPQRWVLLQFAFVTNATIVFL